MAATLIPSAVNKTVPTLQNAHKSLGATSRTICASDCHGSSRDCDNFAPFLLIRPLSAHPYPRALIGRQGCEVLCCTDTAPCQEEDDDKGDDGDANELFPFAVQAHFRVSSLDSFIIARARQGNLY